MDVDSGDDAASFLKVGEEKKIQQGLKNKLHYEKTQLREMLSHTRSKREGKEGVKVDRVGEAFVVEINCPYGRNNRTLFSCRDCYSCGKQLDIHIL